MSGTHPQGPQGGWGPDPYGQQPPPPPPAPPYGGPPSYGGAPSYPGPGTPPGHGMPGPPGPPPRPPRGGRGGARRFGNWIAVVAAGTVATVVAMIIIIKMDDKKAEDQQEAAASASATAPAVMPALPSHAAPTNDPQATASASLDATTAPQTPDAPPAPQQNGRFVAKPDDLSTWPDACALLTPDDIKKVIPGTTAVSQLGTAETYGYFKDRGTALRSTTCSMAVETTRQFSNYSKIKIEVRFRDINTPKIAKERFTSSEGAPKRVATDYKDLGTTTGADDSYWATSDLTLVKGGYFIEIYASGSLTTESGDLWRFGDWAPQLVPQLAKALTARI